MNSYSHLSIHHRQLLGKLKKQGKSSRHIARILGVAPSTISREIKRNYIGFGYCCNLAHWAQIHQNHHSRIINPISNWVCSTPSQAHLIDD